MTNHRAKGRRILFHISTIVAATELIIMSGLRKDCNTMDGERLKSRCKWLISRSIAVIAKVGPIITIKANIDATVKEIRGALTDTQVQIFKKTCFGHWLDISLKRNNQLLIHTLLTCMVDSVANELSFLVSGKRIRFRRQEFCLVTGLRFGSNMYMKEWVKNMAENSFRNRIFPDIEARSVKLSDVIAIFDKMRDKSLVLETMNAVKNIDALNKRQVSHDDKREKGAEIRYTLTGFVYAFMIWILEVIPATHVYVSKEPMEKIPRRLGEECAEEKGKEERFITPFIQKTKYDTVDDEPLKDTHLDDSDAAKDAAKDTHLDVVTTISVPMTTTEIAFRSNPGTGHDNKKMNWEIIRIKTTTKKPSYDLPDLTKIRRGKYPIFTTFEKKKTDCYLDCLPKGRVCETSFWDILWPGGENVDYLEQGMLDGLHINAFIEVMMRKRPCNAQWTLGHSELVAFYKDSSNLRSMVSVVDVVRATIDGTNPRYPAWDKISQVFFPINLDNQHWVAASWNLDDYQLFVYDSLEWPENYTKMINLLKKWKDFIKKDLESMDWFKKTKRDLECFRISLRYINDMPRQSSMYGTLDCGVMTCKFIEMLTKGKTIDAKKFGANVAKKCQEFRAKMALMLYDTRCERPV
ncbi:phospholipase-like protein [Tanacetum coccineum]